MNFKNISLIIPLLCVNLKVIAGPVNNETVDISFGNESDDEVYSLGEEIDLNGDDVKVVDIFSDDENIATEIIDTDEEECTSEECIQASKRILGNMDISINPCDNFYQFTCGGWEAKSDSHEIKVENSIDNQIREILESEYIVDEKLSKEDQAYDEKTFKKLKNMYNICMNKEINESYPNERLINYINNLNITENKENLKNPEALSDLLAKLQINGADSYVQLIIIKQESVSDMPVIGLSFSEDMFIHSMSYMVVDKLPRIIPALKNYIKTVITSILGENTNIDSIVDSIYETEKKMAKIYSREIYSVFDGNIYANFEAERLNELNEKLPFMNWNSYLKKIFEFYNMNEYFTDDMIIVNLLPKYFNGLNEIINEMTVDDIVYYLQWCIINMSSLKDYINTGGDIEKAEMELNEITEELGNELSPEELNEIYGIDFTKYIDFDEDTFENVESSSTVSKLFGKSKEKILHNLRKRDETEKYSVKEEDRYSICSTYLDSLMPMAISKYFIKRNFNDNIKDEVKEMIENVKEAMINRIPKMEWLDEETKQHAIEKVQKMKDRIGYPDDIMVPKKLYQKYESLEIDNLFDLIIKYNILSFGISLKTMDINEWLMTPYTYNAYYHFNSNSINFPAGILRAPYYESNGQDYINYGAAGSLIGHELTHAFDDTGRLYDIDGHHNNWWTDNDNEEFNEYSQCFIDEYNAITYNVSGRKFNVNGEKTLGENLADNGGLARAYDAWQLSLLKNPEKAVESNKKLPGFENYTIEQLFYIAYGQTYCSKNYDILGLDVHAPQIARVNGVVANSKHFAKTFNCPTNSPMNPENKCVIW